MAGSVVRRAGLLGLVCVGGLLWFGGVCAFGAQTRNLVSSFGSLSNPQGVAVVQSNGDVLVADAGNNRVEEFDPLGNLLLGFGGSVGGPGVDTCTVLCGVGASGSAPGEFTFAKFVAIDNSGGASNGDMYVGDTGDNLVSKFDSSGKLVASWGSGGQLNGSTTGAKSFGSLAGVAVDATGTLYVLNTSHEMFTFGQDGSFTSEFSLTGEFLSVTPNGLALDAVHNLFKVSGGGPVGKYNGAGVEIGTVTPAKGGFTGFVSKANALAIEPASGDLYVATAGQAIEHFAFNGSGEVTEPSGVPCPVQPGEPGCKASDSVEIPFAGTGIAVSTASGDVFMANPVAGQLDVYEQVTIPDVVTLSVTNVGPTEATLLGTVNPDEIALTECEFEYVDDATYESEVKAKALNPYAAGHAISCVPSAAAIGNGAEPVEVHADVSGLTAGTAYDFRLKAANEHGPNFGSSQEFSTLPPPSIDSATVTSLTGSSAILNAKIDPMGSETHYRFEYGMSTAYGTSYLGDIPSGLGDVLVSQPIAGLIANTTYHWRVVAENANGTTTGSDHRFFYDTTGAGLPDGRAYEMVTPPQKNGALIGSIIIVGRVPDISRDGSRVIAESIQCFAGAGSCNAQQGDGAGSPYEFTRTSAGWVTTPLSPPATQFPVGPLSAYSAEAGAALFTLATPPRGENDFYVREPDGRVVNIGPNTPPEEGPQGPLGGAVTADLQTNTADFSHLVWHTDKPHSTWPFDAGQSSVYEYAGTGNLQPLLVGVSGGTGSSDLISVCGTQLGGRANVSIPGSMSADGRTVYFTALGTEGGAPCFGTGPVNEHTEVPADAVYARIDGESADAHTVAISQPSPSQCGGGEEPDERACREASAKPAGGELVGASADGAKAFFTSTQQLTDGASEDSDGGDSATANGCVNTRGANGCNLYEYECLNHCPHPAEEQHLIDVSAGDVSGGGPRVQGVVALSPDGSHVYFVAKGVLTVAANANGQFARNSANNLYVFERDASFPQGRVMYIAELQDLDSEEWSAAGAPANVTPDGRFLVFVSTGNLTPDDTSVSGARQVFRYDAQTGALVRISVGSNGLNDNGNRSSATLCGVHGCSEDARIAQALGRSRSDPTMSDAGTRVFFQSPVGLAPHALDDVQIGTEEGGGGPIYAQNVYEWEQEGAGSCPAGHPAGCVSLISDGRDVSIDAGQNSQCTFSSVCLWGADTAGANVFFQTVDPLVPQDTDTELDFYDARICEPEEGNPCISSPPPPLPPCLGEACHGTPAATLSAPGGGTLTFDGTGNLTSTAPVKPTPKPKKCKKGFVKKRSKCVKKRKAKKAQAKKGSHRRRVKR